MYATKQIQILTKQIQILTKQTQILTKQTQILMSECTLSKETQDLLYRYFAAAANLYGVIEIGKLLKIYNSQNEPVSEEDFLSFVKNMNFKGKYFCVFNQDDIYDDGSETPALEQEILAEYLYFFEVPIPNSR